MRVATRADAGEVGRTIGVAFREDPVSRWAFGGPEAVEVAYRLLAQRVYVPHARAVISDAGGAALWVEPGGRAVLGARDTLRMAGQLTRASGPRHVLRTAGVDAAMQRRHPTQPHYYLFAIGVLPEARGQGIAGALLRDTLALADASGTPTYLENSNPVNTPLYRRFGFEARAPFSPMRGCPPLLPMWREPGG